MTLRKLNATRTGSARPAPDYHVIYKDGLYRVFDKAGKFRVGFATPEAANAYVAQRSVAPRPSQFAPSDERIAA